MAIEKLLSLSSAGNINETGDIYYDNTNGRVGIKASAPSVPLDVDGQIKSDAAVSVDSSGYGSVNLIIGGTLQTGYIEFRKPDGTRTGYIGYSSDIAVNLENSARFTVSGGYLELNGDPCFFYMRDTGSNRSSKWLSNEYRVEVSNYDNNPWITLEGMRNSQTRYVDINCLLSTAAGRVKAYEIHTAADTLTNTDKEINYGDTDGGAFTLTLPASPTDGIIFILKNTGSSANNLTVARNGNNIDGAASDKVLADNEKVTLQYTTDGWQTI